MGRQEVEQQTRRRERRDRYRRDRGRAEGRRGGGRRVVGGTPDARGIPDVEYEIHILHPVEALVVRLGVCKDEWTQQQRFRDGEADVDLLGDARHEGHRRYERGRHGLAGSRRRRGDADQLKRPALVQVVVGSVGPGAERIEQRPLHVLVTAAGVGGHRGVAVVALELAAVVDAQQRGQHVANVDGNRIVINCSRHNGPQLMETEGRQRVSDAVVDGELAGVRGRSRHGELKGHRRAPHHAAVDNSLF